jgi:hypothetical protein
VSRNIDLNRGTTTTFLMMFDTQGLTLLSIETNEQLDRFASMCSRRSRKHEAKLNQDTADALIVAWLLTFSTEILSIRAKGV